MKQFSLISTLVLTALIPIAAISNEQTHFCGSIEGICKLKSPLRVGSKCECSDGKTISPGAAGAPSFAVRGTHADEIDARTALVRWFSTAASENNTGTMDAIKKCANALSKAPKEKGKSNPVFNESHGEGIGVK